MAKSIVKTKTKYVLGTVTLLLVALAMIILAHTPATPALQFCGLATLARDGRWEFTISNTSDRAIGYMTLAPQVKSNGQWVAVQYQSGRGARIAPNQSTTAAVNAPTSGRAWRLPVMWEHPPTRFAVYMKKVEMVIDPQTTDEFPLKNTAYSPEVVR